MHNYWVGLVADLWRAGDKSNEWLLREVAAGEVFAAGHAELLDHESRATPSGAEGRYIRMDEAKERGYYLIRIHPIPS